MPDTRCDLAVIGGGIIGLATALEASRTRPGLRVVVLEKEAAVAAHQTGHNSGVIHSGLYYKPGSLKARLCVAGAAAMVAFCREHGIAHDICGKVVVATSPDELPALEELHRRGLENGVHGLRLLDPSEICSLEPYTTGVRGLHVPGTGIVDYTEVSRKYAELICSSGGEVRTSAEVVRIKSVASKTVLQTRSGEIKATHVINCAGLYSDRIARMAGAEPGVQIVPFRGEYYEMIPEKHHLVRGLIYPVPDARFPFLGVHFTRRIHGGVEAGPNAVLALKREGYSKTSFDFGEATEIATFPGFWKMARRYWKAGFGEYHRSLSKAAFVRALQKLLPELEERDLKPGGSGVRAQALSRDGKFIDDFHFLFTDGMTHVLNVPSPAATASLVIAKEIVSRVSDAALIR